MYPTPVRAAASSAAVAQEDEGRGDKGNHGNCSARRGASRTWETGGGVEHAFHVLSGVRV